MGSADRYEQQASPKPIPGSSPLGAAAAAGHTPPAAAGHLREGAHAAGPAAPAAPGGARPFLNLPVGQHDLDKIGFDAGTPGCGCSAAHILEALPAASQHLLHTEACRGVACRGVACRGVACRSVFYKGCSL
jgi:hypothetical protein